MVHYQAAQNRKATLAVNSLRAILRSRMEICHVCVTNVTFLQTDF